MNSYCIFFSHLIMPQLCNAKPMPTPNWCMKISIQIVFFSRNHQIFICISRKKTDISGDYFDLKIRVHCVFCTVFCVAFYIVFYAAFFCYLPTLTLARHGSSTDSQLPGLTSPHWALWRKAWSINTRASMASAIGVALMPTQGS